MADDDVPVATIGGTPRNMRPRSTPNAEINAQKADQFRYAQGIFERPTVKDIPLRGYGKGGRVAKGPCPGAKHFPTKVISCS
jgi:hypothetical protein